MELALRSLPGAPCLFIFFGFLASLRGECTHFLGKLQPGYLFLVHMLLDDTQIQLIGRWYESDLVWLLDHQPSCIDILGHITLTKSYLTNSILFMRRTVRFRIIINVGTRR